MISEVQAAGYTPKHWVMGSGIMREILLSSVTVDIAVLPNKERVLNRPKDFPYEFCGLPARVDHAFQEDYIVLIVDEAI